MDSLQYVQVSRTEPCVRPDRQQGEELIWSESRGPRGPVSFPDMPVRTEAAHGEGQTIQTEPLVRPRWQRGKRIAESSGPGGRVSRPDMPVRTETAHGEGQLGTGVRSGSHEAYMSARSNDIHEVEVLKTEPHVRPCRQWGSPWLRTPFRALT